MCGFTGFGLHDLAARPDEEMLARMADSIAHRGPDDRTLHLEGPFGLGFRRLSIIDPEGGRQPLFNETREIAMLMNGEVYNHRELRAKLEAKGHRFRTGSDAEVLAHLYEEYDTELVQHLVGMYAFAIVDRRQGRNRLVLGRDRLGIKPLYWAHTQQGLVFGSECKTILESGWTARELRPEALLDYLIQGYVGGADAAWSGIQRLPPSGVLTWEPGQAPVVRRSWDLPTDAMREATTDEELLEWFDRVVHDRLEADVPLGAFLSGGVDSTAVVTSMARLQGKPPTVCSVGFAERSHDELEVARRTAERLGAVQHTQVLRPDPSLAIETLPWFYDEPLADPSTVPTYLVSKMAREHVTVALSGDGGDETFAGYRRYLHDTAENALRARIGGVGRNLARGLGSLYPKLDWAPRWLRGKTFLTNLGSDPAQAYWRSVTRMGRAEALALLHPDLVQRLGSHDPFDAFEDHYRRPQQEDALYRAQYADIHTYLPDQILAKVDRASMAVSLEVRVPLLDHRFVERFAHLPTSEKISGGRGKHALRRAMRSRVPSEVLDGTKRGFDTPLRAWLRGPLASAAEAALESLPEDWFRRSELRRIFREHQGGARDHGHLLWSLLVLEHWRQRHAVSGLAR